MVEGSKWNHQLAIWLLRLSLELNVFSLRQGPEMWHTWFLLHSLVYVAKFIGKICLLLKTLADWKTSDSAAFKTNGPFCPEDEIWGPSRSRGSEKHSTVLLSCHPNPEPHLEFQKFAILLEVPERVADKTCLGCWETSIQEASRQPEGYGGENPVHSRSVWTLQTFLWGSTIKVPNEFLSQIPTLGYFIYLPWGS